MGIFRGIIGCDCATSYSYQYAYAPKERTFFIYDQEGLVKGYMQTTDIMIGKDTYLYVHDLTGGRMSAKLVEYVLLASHDVASQLGFKGVVLPTAERIHANNNFDPQRNLMMEMVSSLEQKNLKYLDGNARKLLAQSDAETNAGYDMPEKNSIGHIIEQPKEGLKPKVKILEYTPDFSLDTKISVESGLSLALNFQYSSWSEDALNTLVDAQGRADQGGGTDFKQRIKAANTIVIQLGLDQAHFQGLVSKIGNHQALGVKQYYDAISKMLSSLGIKSVDKFIQHNEYLFAYGHLRASDSTDKKSADVSTTIRHAIGLLKRWPTPEVVVNAWSRNPEAFDNSKAFQNYLRKLVDSEADKLGQLAWLFERGVSIQSLYDLKAEIKHLAGLYPEINRLAYIPDALTPPVRTCNSLFALAGGK
jgi:hypothetical protein